MLKPPRFINVRLCLGGAAISVLLGTFLIAIMEWESIAGYWYFMRIRSDSSMALHALCNHQVVWRRKGLDRYLCTDAGKELLFRRILGELEALRPLLFKITPPAYGLFAICSNGSLRLEYLVVSAGIQRGGLKCDRGSEIVELFDLLNASGQNVLISYNGIEFECEVTASDNEALPGAIRRWEAEKILRIRNLTQKLDPDWATIEAVVNFEAELDRRLSRRSGQE